MKGHTEHLLSFVGAIVDPTTVQRLLEKHKCLHFEDIDLHCVMTGKFRYDPEGTYHYWVGMYVPQIWSLNYIQQTLPEVMTRVARIVKDNGIDEPVGVYNLLAYY